MNQCPYCLNKDPIYFYTGTRGVYCRKCVAYIQEKESTSSWDISENPELSMNYPLTSAQLACSKVIASECMTSSVLVEAVCGAGKTELVLEAIKEGLINKIKIGWAIPRRQVVLELTQRLTKLFPKSKVICVCQGFTSITDGDLIVCTTHQLFRYPHWFDLLIMDEPDAFPFKGNQVLQMIAQKSCRGHMIYLTATVDDYLKSRVSAGKCKHVILNERPHKHPVVEPKLLIQPRWTLYLIVYMLIRDLSRQWIIFVPSMNMAKKLSWILRCDYITSKSSNKDEIIRRFSKRENRILVSTTILERGVTFENIYVCVLMANHPVFDEASLVQMSGRVGRTFNFPTGDCVFLCDQKEEFVISCIKKIQQANRSVYGVQNH